MLYLTDSSGIFSDRRLAELLNRTESMPSIAEPERFSFWVFVPEIESLQICFNYKSGVSRLLLACELSIRQSEYCTCVEDFKRL